MFSRRLIFEILLVPTFANAQTGPFLPEEKFHSDILDEDRTIRVWSPPSYEEKSGKYFPMVYLHDEQNKLSSVGPHVAFGWGNREVNKSIERLVKEAQISQHNETYRRLRVWRALEFLFPKRDEQTTETRRTRRGRAQNDG